MLCRWLEGETPRETRHPADLAAALRVSRSAVHAWRTGRARPSYGHARPLEIITGGQVLVEHWAHSDLARDLAKEVKRIPGVPQRLRGHRGAWLRAVPDLVSPSHSGIALRAWLRALRIPHQQLASALGVTPQTVWLWASMRRHPSFEVARALEIASCGLISMADWTHQQRQIDDEMINEARDLFE